MRLNRFGETISPVQAGMSLKQNLDSASAVPGGGSARPAGSGWLATVSSDMRQFATGPLSGVITRAVVSGAKVSTSVRKLRICQGPVPALICETGVVSAQPDEFSLRTEIHRRSQLSEEAHWDRRSGQKQAMAQSDVDQCGISPRRRRHELSQLPAWIGTRRKSEI